ncbi:MAG TPA: hypothetical protein PKN21_07550 [Bacteroidales bacterium]|nr:hypothetical protein [Bacteroidales bacterium]
MKTFYSILYVLITPETAEKLSLGVLLSDGKQSLFRYSKPKLNVIGELLAPAQIKFIKAYLKSISLTTSFGTSASTELDLQFNPVQLSSVGEQYISYLGKYNYNFLVFGDPIGIDVPVNQEIIDKLFARLIHEKPVKTSGKHQLEKVKEEFSIKAKPFYSIDREIDQQEYPELIMPVTIDFFGKNEKPVYAQFLDFEKAINHVKNDYFDVDQLIETIKGKGFVISKEPDSVKFPNQHQAWTALRRSPKTEYVDSTEIERVYEYAVEHGVVPI